ncbi:hypothetical protein [Amycolatopsis sp.]|uniref:hypothetical protein n=1 Tax=Amycolatopsis sp. TaxID=37632 RepID=UPI002CFC6DEF|nr:hypothetical protein [Amycolatopsis sp.]HVV13298.1 hypothetical protein [Amycolatopsis sp.]
MTDRTDTPSVAEAARLLDDMTQQMTPVPALLDEHEVTEKIEVIPPADSNLEGHVF